MHSLHTYMTYGSSESGALHNICSTSPQGNETVNAYERFHRMLEKQKKRVKNAEDNHIYHYMFIVGLDKINGEVLRLPESLRIEDIEMRSLGSPNVRTDGRDTTRVDSCMNYTAPLARSLSNISRPVRQFFSTCRWALIQTTSYCQI